MSIHIAEIANFILLRLSNIHIYTYTCIDNHIFIHSSVNAHLGFFHILLIINNASLNIGVHISFRITIFVFFGNISSSIIAGSYGSFIFIFLRKLHTVSTLAATVYIPTNSVQGLPFVSLCAENGQGGSGVEAAGDYQRLPGKGLPWWSGG